MTLIDPKDGRTPGMMFKLLGVDFVGKDLGQMQPFKVVHAYVLLDQSVIAKGSPMQCENTLGQCSIHQGDTWLKVADRMAKESKLTVSFSRSATGLALILDIPVKEEALNSLVGCMKQMIGS